MQANFTINDLLATAVAILVYPLFVFIPGYVLGWLLNLLSFRKQTPLIRLLLSLPFSVALTPVLVYLLGRQFSMAGSYFFYGLLWGIFAVMLLSSRSKPGSPNPFAGVFPAGVWKPVIWISAIWVAVTALSLVDLQIGKRLYYSVVAYDYTVRSAAVSQLARTDWLPPSNPFFFPGHAAPFRYHYFWFLLCSFPHRMMHNIIGPRHALYGGVVWIGFTLMATVALFLRFFDPAGAKNIRRRTYIALGLLSISGLDVLPTLLYVVTHFTIHVSSVFASVDWWNPDQVTGWLDSAFWVPHHLAGLLACLIGFLILWFEWQHNGKRLRWQSILGAGIAFGSASGLSIYVAFVFAGFLGIWAIFMLLRKEQAMWLSLCLAGAIAAVLALPFLLDLLHAGTAGTTTKGGGDGTGNGASFMRFGIRMFGPAHAILYQLHRDQSLWVTLADILCLPINFLFELGALMVIGVIRIRQWQRKEQPWTPASLAAVIMIGVSLLISIFVRSNTIDTNDLGIRGMLIVQFMLVLWGTQVLGDWRMQRVASPDRMIRFAQAGLGITLLLGVATNVYELFLLRTYVILVDHGMDPGTNIVARGAGVAEQTYATRELYEWLNHHVPLSAVEQHNPEIAFDQLPGLYADRQIAMTNLGTVLSFGGDRTESYAAAEAIQHVFADEKSIADPDGICQAYKIDYLIVRKGDPAWEDSQSWVWKRTPLYANARARSYPCKVPQAP